LNEDELAVRLAFAPGDRASVAEVYRPGRTGTTKQLKISKCENGKWRKKQALKQATCACIYATRAAAARSKPGLSMRISNEAAA
jgi:hypothetical protein